MVSRMNKSQLKQLIKINLLYLNPQQTQQYRKKGKTGSAITAAILRQYLMLTILFLVLYSGQLFPVNFLKFPGLFTYYLGLFAIMEITQIITSVYSVFYNSQDFEAYAPLPFSRNAIFFSKLIVVGLSVTPFLIPQVALFILTGIRATYGVVLGAIWGVLLILVVLLLVFCIGTLLVFGISKISYLQQHRKLLTSILVFLPVMLMFFSIFIINFTTNSSSATSVDVKPFALLLPFYQLLKAPTQVSQLLFFVAILLVIAVTLWLMIKFLLPTFYATKSVSVSKKKTRHHRYGARNLRRQLWHYNFGLIKDPNLLMQVFANNLMPIMMIMIVLMGGGRLSLAKVSANYWGAFILAGIFFAVFSINQASIVANVISLDRQNFSFINTLPIEMNTYLRHKFNFAAFCQILIMTVILVIASLFLKIPILFALILLASNIIAGILVSEIYFTRDLRRLNSEWTNVNQLFTRGGGNFMVMITLFLTIIAAVAVIGIYFALLMIPLISPVIINLVILLIAIIVGGSVGWHYHNKFWQQLDHVDIKTFIKTQE